jgi:hypothetical protein
VARTFVRESDELQITTADGRNVEATPGKGFVEAKRLARSDLLRDARGALSAVATVSSRRGTFRVYNFDVEPTHTYFAGG